MVLWGVIGCSVSAQVASVLMECRQVGSAPNAMVRNGFNLWTKPSSALEGPGHQPWCPRRTDNRQFRVERAVAPPELWHARAPKALKAVFDENLGLGVGERVPSERRDGIECFSHVVPCRGVIHDAEPEGQRPAGN